MGDAQLDPWSGPVVEVQQRRPAADGRQLGAPLLPGGLGHVDGGVVRVPQTQRRGSGDLARGFIQIRTRGLVRILGQVSVIMSSISTPHMATLAGRATNCREAWRVSPRLRVVGYRP